MDLANYRHIVIVNKVAGKGQYVEVCKEMEIEFKRLGYFYEFIYTKSKGHATKIAKSFDNENLRLYSVGGDGTLNEVINGADNKEVVCIPTGSGNDFIRSITIKRDPIKIFKESLNREAKYIDTFKINNTRCINIASLGFDANVVFNMIKFKHWPLVKGEFAYLLSIFYTLLKYDSYSLSIKVDGKCIKEEVMLLAIANGKYYGGGMMPAPMAVLDDGQLELCVIEKMPRRKIIAFLNHFKKGLHVNLKEVSFLKGKNILINCDKKFRVNIDGEVSEANEIKIEIETKKIKFVF